MITKEKVQEIEKMTLELMGKIEDILSDEPIQKEDKRRPYKDIRLYENVHTEFLNGICEQISQGWIHLGRLIKRL